MRLRVWQPGQVDKHTCDLYSLKRFPQIEKQRVFEVSRLIVDPSARGTPVAPSLFQRAYQLVVDTYGAYLGFLYCAPGLTRAYRRLGFRSYQGDLISSPDGMRVPMVMIVNDLGFFERVGSPLTPLVRHHFPTTGATPPGLEEYQKLVEGAFHHYELNPEKVWRELQDELLTDQSPASLFLENVPTEELKRLSNMAAVMDVPAGGTVTRAELVEEEIFLILEGVFEVLVDGRQVDLLHVGDIFGELAFFLSTHRRTATIQAVTDGQVLVIGRRFLAKIRKENPTLAADLLFNLCRIMADRQARTDSVCYGQHGQETG
jgi:hypothetical protein